MGGRVAKRACGQAVGAGERSIDQAERRAGGWPGGHRGGRVARIQAGGETGGRADGGEVGGWPV